MTWSESSQTVSLSVVEFRRRLFRWQCLPRVAGNPVDAVSQAGPVRTLGGVDVYLALRARSRIGSRSEVDRRVMAGELVVSPAMRGCIYLTDREWSWACLRMADLLSARRRQRESQQAGFDIVELGAVGEAIVSCLGDGPATTAELRSRLPSGVIRSLGEAGRKVGISSTLPPALRELEFGGSIARILVDGQLDSERYAWRLSPDGAGQLSELPGDPAGIYQRFARLFFDSAGCSSVEAFQWWSGLGKGAAGAAMRTLDLTPVQVEGSADLKLATRDFLAGESPSANATVVFLPFLDNLVHLQGEARAISPPQLWPLRVPVWGRGRVIALGEATHSSFRAIVVDGTVIGFWEFDPDSAEVVTNVLVDSPASPSDVERAGLDLAAFLIDELGRAHSSSIDSDAALKERCGVVRGLSLG